MRITTRKPTCLPTHDVSGIHLIFAQTYTRRVKIKNVEGADVWGYEYFCANIDGVPRMIAPSCSVNSPEDCDTSRVCDLCGGVCTHRPKGSVKSESHHRHLCTISKGHSVCTDCLCAIMKQEGTKWKGFV